MQRMGHGHAWFGRDRPPARVPSYEYVLCVMLPLTMSTWELMVMRMRWVLCIITPSYGSCYGYVLCVMLPLTMSTGGELMVMRMRWVCVTCIITPTFSHADAQTILNVSDGK